RYRTNMQLAVTLLIVVLAAAIVLRRAWRLFHSGGKAGCGSGCGSCPSNAAADKPVVTLELSPRRQA
ncbi:MAG: FeoB-associated Cys-rich membrane protein, partial [Planctomycetaceae bacterium]